MSKHFHGVGIGPQSKKWLLRAPIPLLRPYCIAKRTREMLISKIHILSLQNWSQLVHFSL